MSILDKIQKQPELTRKIILWSTIIIIGLGLLILWIKNTQQKLESFQGEGLREKFQIPSFTSSPSLFGEWTPEELKKIEEQLKGAEKEISPEQQ